MEPTENNLEYSQESQTLMDEGDSSFEILQQAQREEQQAAAQAAAQEEQAAASEQPSRTL